MSIEELINKKLEEAIEILKKFGMPSEQQNERTAYCLLSLLNIAPEKAWKNVEKYRKKLKIIKFLVKIIHFPESVCYNQCYKVKFPLWKCLRMLD